MLQLMVTCISRALFTSHPLVWGHDFFFLIPKTQLLSDDLESYTCYQSLLYYPEPPAQMLGLPSSQPPSSFALTVRILFPAPLLAVCWPVMTTPPTYPTQTLTSQPGFPLLFTIAVTPWSPALILDKPILSIFFWKRP